MVNSETLNLRKEGRNVPRCPERVDREQAIRYSLLHVSIKCYLDFMSDRTQAQNRRGRFSYRVCEWKPGGIRVTDCRLQGRSHM